ncbi:MAG: TraB/GumN family protein [Caulobacteraceae bacterium]|nr:TraB/GumN family protein [Caulobacteraceae bacterium]
MRLILAAALALLACAPAQAQPPIWVVRDADSELVLFGSVHVLPEGLDWRPAKLDRALEDADDLWFELPVDAAAELAAAQLAVKAGMLPQGQRLSDLLDADDQARLERVAGRYGLAPAFLDRMQPWFAEVALAAVAYQAAGARADHGVEKQIAARAPATARRRAFESVEEQLAIFIDTPREAQVASLSASLKEMEADPRAFEDLVAAWMRGDVSALRQEALEPLKAAAPILYRRLVTERNARWLAALQKRLAGSGETVVVVGVGHLLGPDGLPERLRALGYSVEGP